MTKNQKGSASLNGHGKHGEESGGDTDLQLARLVYLISRHQLRIPKTLGRHLPAGEWLVRLYAGPSSAGFTSTKLLQRFKRLYEQGKELGIGSREEGAALVLRLLDDVAFRRDDISPEERVALYKQAERFITASQSLLQDQGGKAVISLDKVKPGPGVPKYMTGFGPVDATLSGGAYQGIFIVMGKPGDGKTTIMAALQAGIVRAGSANSTLYVENEIPREAMLGRISPLILRTKFRKTDKMVCSSWGIQELEEYVEENPDPDRVILFDSPDVSASATEDKRLQLEDIYKRLIRLKQKSKSIFCASWPNRKSSGGVLTMESVAESWAKAWYADGILTVARLPQGVRMTAVKNRFGIKDQSVLFPFDYDTLAEGDTVAFEQDEDW